MRDGKIDLEEPGARTSDKNANVSRMKFDNGDVVTVPRNERDLMRRAMILLNET